VNEVEVASIIPITTELEVGVKEVTEALPELVAELPVEDSRPVFVYPVISYTRVEPVTEAEKVAVMVSLPELAAVAYQM
jgi:hypothetical protein